MTDISDLVQEFWTSSNGAVGTPFFPKCSSCLLEILQSCLFSLQREVTAAVRSDIISFFATVVNFPDNNLQKSTNPYYHSRPYRGQSVDDRIILRDKLLILFNGYRKMIEHSFSKSKDLGDMLRFLPGVVVQKNLGMQGMADLYRVKPDFLERLKSIGLLTPSPHDLYPRYMLDRYLFGFLQDRDSSQVYCCDLKHQHISICRQILSLLDRSNVFDLHS